MMDPVVTYYGKGLLSGFPVDPNGVIDVVRIPYTYIPNFESCIFAYFMFKGHLIFMNISLINSKNARDLSIHNPTQA